MGQHPVNIVYPIDGETYPKMDPLPAGAKSAYIAFSFGTTCTGGPRTVKWGVDATSLGSAKFYDEFSAQFVWKLPKGDHTFWVESACGKNAVKFKIA